MASTLMAGFSRRFRSAAPAAILLYAVCCVPATRAQAGSELQAPSIRANVEVVSVDVTVTDAQGRFAESLRKDDFHVFDDGLE